MARNRKKAGKSKGAPQDHHHVSNSEEMETKSITIESKSPSLSFCLLLDKNPYNMFAVADAEYKYYKMKVRC